MKRDPSWVKARIAARALLRERDGRVSARDARMARRRAVLLKAQAKIYVDPCTSAAFTASPDWFVRAFRCERRHVTFTFPHPIDILASKIKRLEEKDLLPFKLVREKTGHPDEEDLVQ